MMILFLLAIFSTCQAQWQRPAIEWVESYNREHQECRHWFTPYPGAQTVANNAFLLGQIATQEFTLTPHYPGGRVHNVWLDKPHFKSPAGETLPLKIEAWAPEEAKNGWIVLLPGVFQAYQDAQMYYLIQTFIRQGYRVAVIPNPLSYEYLSCHPVEGPASLPEEARIVGETLRWIRRNLASSSPLHVFGMSYGTFLATIASAQDPSLLEVVDGQITLLSMPWRIGRALQKVDELSTQGLGLQVLGHLFNRRLGAAVTALKTQFEEDQRQGFKARTYEPRVAENFARLSISRDLKFLWALEHLTPHHERFAESSLEDRMAYWLKKLDERGFGRLRIITMKNDLLSDPRDLDEVPARYRSPEHLLVRNEGEHSGYFGSRWFARFLQTAFPRDL